MVYIEELYWNVLKVFMTKWEKYFKIDGKIFLSNVFNGLTAFAVPSLKMFVYLLAQVDVFVVCIPVSSTIQELATLI